MATNVILIFVIVVGVILAGAGLYVYLRNRSMEEIRADVYQLFLVAEHTFTESGSGKQKWSGLSVKQEASCLAGSRPLQPMK